MLITSRVHRRLFWVATGIGDFDQSNELFQEIEKNEWTHKIFLLILKWGAAPFPAVFSPLLVPFGKGAIGPFGFQPLKRGLVPSAGAVYGKMTPISKEFTVTRHFILAEVWMELCW